ncbi:substrate-binding domain-containing protein [Limnohabitans sp. 15K]|uniref:molybdate ABC transporter substrate-binding protein n=1 Tax=Limnohabitans sp. 15K TaxID=1100706 RepID=UPI000C1DF23B|nr:substrate-binding domain-containing protein [Limnohabitans sp. 15K]PIT80269.1 molybdate ABC transporter substrate-binding protein [Limnohabitans sp. 15K]
MHLLSGGAAAAVVQGVQAEFEKTTGSPIDGTFSAVGMMRDKLLGGAPCDVIILTKPLIEQLIASGHVVPGSARSLGLVKTGVAVPSGTPHPKVQTRAELHAAMSAAQGIYFPDPDKATAGIHFMNVLKALGLNESLQSRFRVFPNGATAMAAMAQSQEAGLIGCTQVTEINYTEGVDLVDVLPSEFELSTDYTLGICTAAQSPEQALVLAQLLAGPASASVRKQGGFEF